MKRLTIAGCLIALLMCPAAVSAAAEDSPDTGEYAFVRQDDLWEGNG